MDERGAARIGGQVTNPGGTERLHEYWVHGEGAKKVRWGTPGDFQRCVDHLGKYIRDPQGYCNLAHLAAVKAAAGAKAAGAGKHVAHHTPAHHKARRKTARVHSLKARIASLRHRIATLREQANALDARAAKL